MSSFEETIKTAREKYDELLRAEFCEKYENEWNSIQLIIIDCLLDFFSKNVSKCIYTFDSNETPNLKKNGFSILEDYPKFQKLFCILNHHNISLYSTIEQSKHDIIEITRSRQNGEYSQCKITIRVYF